MLDFALGLAIVLTCRKVLMVLGHCFAGLAAYVGYFRHTPSAFALIGQAREGFAATGAVCEFVEPWLLFFLVGMLLRLRLA